MSDFKEGDEVWWFESICGAHWTERFFAEQLYIESGIYEGKDVDGNCLIKNKKTEYSRPENYYKSKNEAIDAMIKRLESMRDE